MTPAEIGRLVDDRPQDGVFRVHRDAFTSERVFALELRHVFEENWNFLALASQLPSTNDYYCTWLGRHPVVLMHGQDGRLRAFHDTCRHRRARLCHETAGNRRVHVCRYHGWSYDSTGRNIGIKDRAEGAYPACFDAESHDLEPLARFAEYRGFLFGSAAADGPALDEHLGDARRLLDLVVDRDPAGVVCVPGEVSYTFEGNWKFQIENGTDAYHFTSTHPSYIEILARRGSRAAAGSVYENFRNARLFRGSFGFARGHNAIFGPNPSARGDEAVLAARVGETAARWMGYTRNCTIFPNIQIAENASMQLRVLRPLSPSRTAMRTWCLAPKGESGEALRRRIRQYEEFFNPGGLATPDDIANYEDCQTGYSGAPDFQQGYVRGFAMLQAGANAHAHELGIVPATASEGPFERGDETVLHAPWREWQRRLLEGAGRTPA